MGAPCPEARASLARQFFAGAPELPVSADRSHNILHGFLCEEFTAYATEIADFERETFDVVMIDGMARTLTAWMAAQYIKRDGIIVFDNTDRWQYNGAYRLLNAAGFRRIDFYGPGPVNRQEWCTSLFVRDLNVFQDNIDSPHDDCDLNWYCRLDD